MPEASLDAAREAVMTGAIWTQFCDLLKRAGEQVMRPEAPAGALERAEGFRYLSRLVRVALEMHVEFADPDFPGFIAPSHETVKIGADNPDNLYLSARLDGRNDYRVTGSRGTVHALNFSTKKGGYANRNGRMEGSGYLDAKSMRFAADGGFELILSRERRPGNWLPMEPETNQLIVRQTFLDRSAEKPAAMRIERLGAAAQPPALDAASFHEKLLRAGAFVENTARLFADWSREFKSLPNQLPPRDQGVYQAAGGDPNIFYYHGYWELADDEAMVIDMPRIPPCDFWNFQLDNWWMESLDYRYHRIHLNMQSAVRNADGSVRLIVAHQHPGQPNWIETAGHRCGTMCWRWIGARDPVQPLVRVVKVDTI